MAPIGTKTLLKSINFGIIGLFHNLDAAMAYADKHNLQRETLEVEQIYCYN